MGDVNETIEFKWIYLLYPFLQFKLNYDIAGGNDLWGGWKKFRNFFLQFLLSFVEVKQMTS